MSWNPGGGGNGGGAGLPGPPGQTPYIGTNGHWWIGDTDTGVVAAGGSGPGDVDLSQYVRGDQAATVDDFSWPIGQFGSLSQATDVVMHCIGVAGTLTGFILSHNSVDMTGNATDRVLFTLEIWRDRDFTTVPNGAGGPHVVMTKSTQDERFRAGYAWTSGATLPDVTVDDGYPRNMINQRDLVVMRYTKIGTGGTGSGTVTGIKATARFEPIPLTG
jgi:hypothetical protein